MEHLAFQLNVRNGHFWACMRIKEVEYSLTKISLIMKPFSLAFALVAMLTLSSCSKDGDIAPGTLKHTGEKWNITSVDYNIVDVGLSNPANWVNIGTATNAGAFYFNGSQGSFDIVIDGERQEDYFGYTIDGSSVTIVTIDQNISPSNFSQSVIAFTGEKVENTMTMSGTITRQSTSGEYVLTGDFVLTRN
jgi:hypothetical protein